MGKVSTATLHALIIDEALVAKAFLLQILDQGKDDPDFYSDKAFRHIVAQALVAGVPVEDIVANRFGMNALTRWFVRELPGVPLHHLLPPQEVRAGVYLQIRQHLL